MQLNNVFITGATGFIGSHLCGALKERNNVIALVRDNIPSEWLSEALSDCTLVRGDVTDTRLMIRVMNQYKVDKVYHTAAETIVKRAHIDPLNTYYTNVMGCVAVLEGARQTNVQKICLLNTDKIYGDRMNASVDDVMQAGEPYATSKAIQRLIGESYAQTYGMKIISPSFCNIFGYDLNDRIIPNTIKKCLRGEQPEIFVNDESIREFIYVDDVARTLIKMMDGEYVGAFNVTAGWLSKQEEIVLKILSHFPILKAKYVKVQLPRQIIRQSLQSNWQLNPVMPFNEALETTIRKFRHYRKDWDVAYRTKVYKEA